MAQTFTYIAFGLIIESEIEIPELIISKGTADVQIKLDKTPENLSEIKQRGVKYQATKNEFLLEVDEIAKYYVKNGDEIIIELLKDKADKEVNLFLLGSAFGALFIQRGLLPIHGSAVKFGDYTTIFTGLSGVGKSSIAGYFANQGFHILADDISVINHDLKVVPGFPSVKLWNDVLHKLEITTDSLHEIRPDIKKFKLPISENYFNQTLPLKNIVILGTKNTPGFEIEELQGIKKFNAIKNNTYRYKFVQGLEKQQEHFQILNKLLQQTTVYKITRPQSPLQLKELGDFVLKKLNLDV